MKIIGYTIIYRSDKPNNYGDVYNEYSRIICHYAVPVTFRSKEIGQCTNIKEIDNNVVVDIFIDEKLITDYEYINFHYYYIYFKGKFQRYFEIVKKLKIEQFFLTGRPTCTRSKTIK
jgi:hypothetical protein